MTRENRLDFLVNYLTEENHALKGLTAIEADKFKLYRSLVNIREPKPISEAYLKTEDEFLQNEISKKGVTDINTLKPIADCIYLWQGDITTLKADGIVNAANSGLTGCYCPCHGCIDNAIHTFAGVRLRLACAEIMEKQGCPEPVGKAKITKAYNLPSKYVLHTVGPYISGNVTQNDEKLLADCYRSCLNLADEKGLESLAFCCISTGEFHFPNKEAAEIAVKTVKTALPNLKSLKKIVFNVFKDTDRQIYEKNLAKKI